MKKYIKKIKKIGYVLIQCWYVGLVVFEHLYHYPGNNGDYEVSVHTTISGMGYLKKDG